MISKNNWSSGVFALAIFLVAFLLTPFAQLDFLRMMPGDIGDARLNNYFLENVYRFFLGESDSLWNLGFFYPFPYVLGFSDNLFGASPFYLIARIFGGEPSTAFQIWFLLSYLCNFFAAYYILHRLGASTIASIVGALIFTFALPVSAHLSHAQLYYRFGIVLAVGMFVLFLENKHWRYLIYASGWLVLQFYCGIYIGFFTLLMIVAIAVIYVFRKMIIERVSIRTLTRNVINTLTDLDSHHKLILIFSFASLLVLMMLLFYPYLRVTQLYGVTRHWSEIATMLPRPQSYFLSDYSWWWSSESKVFSSIPMRHEHQMFVGAIPMILAIIGFIFGDKQSNGLRFVLVPASLALLITLTIYLGGFSLWILFYKLPLASAIRAITRIDLVLLFPVAYLAAVAVDLIRTRVEWLFKLLVVVVVPMMIFEFSAISPNLSKKADWRDRISFTESRLPEDLSNEDILFFSQSKGPFYADELDAMWISIIHGVKTINGYSGNQPPLTSLTFGADCAELPKRVLSYLSFIGKKDDLNLYQDIIQRIVPIGFNNCEESWYTIPPSLTSSDRIYSVDDIRQLSYRYSGKKRFGDGWVVNFRIKNEGDAPISAISSLSKPIRISWRFVDSSGQPTTGWEPRKDLPFDILPHSELNVQIYIDPKTVIEGGSLQISVVQELVFWAHDIGVTPLTIPWD